MFRWKDLNDLDIHFWLACCSSFCTYIAVVNTIVIGSKYLQLRFNYSLEEAGYYFTLPYILAAFFSPFIGYFIQRYGQRMSVLLLGSFFMIGAHTFNLCLDDCDRCWTSLVPLFMLGFSYSTFAIILWGALPFMVEGRLLSPAFGICTAC